MNVVGVTVKSLLVSRNLRFDDDQPRNFTFIVQVLGKTLRTVTAMLFSQYIENLSEKRYYFIIEVKNYA